MLTVISDLLDGAARILEQHWRKLPSESISFKSRRDLVTVADHASEKWIVEQIRAQFPDDAIYAEEEARDMDASSSKRWWFVDPLDGTMNFAHGLRHFAVSIGVWEDGDLKYGGVYAPMLGEKYLAEKGKGATRNGEPLRVSPTSEMGHSLVCTGFSYNRNEITNNNLATMGRFLQDVRGVRRLGSASLDIASVAAGHLDIFWEAYLGPFDVAAAVVIAKESGARVTDYLGGEDWLFGEHFVCTNGILHDEALSRLAPIDEGSAGGRFPRPQGF